MTRSPYVEGFGARLLELGYTPGTVRNALKVVGQLGRWMTAHAARARWNASGGLVI
jgi:hypothetical protein